MIRHIPFLLVLLISLGNTAEAQTYAEKLGYPKDAKVVILHVDDAGMSWDANQGAIEALEKGVANSVSIMMPCPWVPGFLHYLQKHPEVDAGLHLTHTAEWTDYRWGPLSGYEKVPGLVDREGALWNSAEEVVVHATADEVETEIRAQLHRARTFGLNPTHLDTHMGTVFAKPEFLERYMKVGIENKIPVMLPGGHNTMLGKQMNASESFQQQLTQAGQLLWTNGLPVLDDLHNLSYNFIYKKGLNDNELRASATRQYSETMREIKPGLTMVIMHCTKPSDVFPYISDSGQIRKADMLAMTDPEFRKFLEKEKFILTTWREVMERRVKAK